MRSSHHGFPAHAGMDPRYRRRSARPRWLPRTRGDGPSGHGRSPVPGAASPHTRGWTRCVAPGDGTVVGFPAHAGMDPENGGQGCPRRRLPRTRGDGPKSRWAKVENLWASPHTRGWTRVFDDHPAHRPGFPAHAGMDPRTQTRTAKRTRLPRTRGDGPEGEHAVIHTVRASPHTRGWTRGVLPRLPTRRGFPAHAGMDPRHTPPRSRRSGLPRTRGDGPHAGISATCAPAASPHTRGWTPAERPRRAVHPGFPAHAGMDPLRR